jgi:hypothetical protein
MRNGRMHACASQVVREGGGGINNGEVVRLGLRLLSSLGQPGRHQTAGGKVRMWGAWRSLGTKEGPDWVPVIPTKNRRTALRDLQPTATAAMHALTAPQHHGRTHWRAWEGLRPFTRLIRVKTPNRHGSVCHLESRARRHPWFRRSCWVTRNMAWHLCLIKIDYSFSLTGKITGPRLPRIPIS